MTFYTMGGVKAWDIQSVIIQVPAPQPTPIFVHIWKIQVVEEKDGDDNRNDKIIKIPSNSSWMEHSSSLTTWMIGLERKMVKWHHFHFQWYALECNSIFQTLNVTLTFIEIRT